MADRREFPISVKREVLHRSNGLCEVHLCAEDVQRVIGRTCDQVGKDFDHKLADCLGGEPTLDNCVLLCRAHHKAKTATDQKARARRNKHTPRKDRPKPGWFQSGKRLQSRGFDKTLTKRFDGSVVRRDGA